MNNFFYARLSLHGLRKNKKIYVPYLLTCIVTITMFYMIHSLSENSSIAAMRGGSTLQGTLKFGSVVVALFAVIFLFYTNSFVIKHRKKEFGLYNVLGMEKRHLGILLLFETAFLCLFSLFIGLAFGVLLDKLMYLIVARVLRSDYGMGFFFSWKSMLATLALFSAVFIGIYLFSLIRIRISRPIELLKGESQGEKEPKTRHLMAIVGAISLVTGYALAILTKDSVSAFELFFFAVLLVILGTYFLFVAGSIALLKLLKKNKKFYYKTNHFTSVSGMTYRMKQNAVGLASICILFTMLLVTLSTTTSFMVGRDDMLAQRYPYDVIVQANTTESANSKLIEDVRALIEENGLTPDREVACRYLPFQAFQNDSEFTVKREPGMETPIILIVLTANSYHKITGESKTLSRGEMLIAESKLQYDHPAIRLFDKDYSVKEKVEPFVPDSFFANGVSQVLGGLYLVVSDDTVLSEIYGQYQSVYGENALSVQLSYGADVTDSEEKQLAFQETLASMLREKNYNARAFVRAAQADQYMSAYGGAFFLGVYLGSLFLMATILIIYYKQISEGYEDQRRFEIMQKVGMSYAEVKRSINSQILLVFFLPLATAGIHVGFAFPMINTIMRMLGLINTKLFALCSLGCFALFSIVYVIVYLLTAKVYYRIVKN